MDTTDHFERTIAFGRIALDQLQALGHTAVPRNYEIWYHYATGYNPSLNALINERLAKAGALSVDDIDRIHDQFFSPTRIGDQIDSIGAKVLGKIDKVMEVLEAARGSASRHSANLAGVSDELGAAADYDSVRHILTGLISTVRDMESSNRNLEKQLVASKDEISKLHNDLEAVRSESLVDPMTTLANRKCFDEMLDKMIARAYATHEPLSLVMTDVDHFKRFNDTYGHPTGDQVLRLVALSMKQNVKGQDLAARYGGEEFVVVLPNTTLRAATTVADYIRRAVMGKELMKRSTREVLGRITISCGVATLHPGDTCQKLIERADQCLYTAKRNGRNQVVCESDPVFLATSEQKTASA